MVRFKTGALLHSLFVCLLLTGCSSKSFRDPLNVQLTGKVMGGEQAITGATIQLYAAYTSASVTTSTALVSATVTTSDGSGNSSNSNANAGNGYNSLPAGYFTITGDYTCPSAGALVYLTSSGGNPGLAPGTNNPVIQQMVTLGACGQLSSSTSVVINEVTTVGSVAALYPYMKAYNQVGSTTGNTDYLNEEFSVATEYMNEAHGIAPGPNLPSGYYGSSNEINTLANVVFTCVNTTGATPGDGSACGSLLSAAKPTAGSAPTDTVGLVIDVLSNPTHNVTSIYNYITTTPPFTPYDLAAPSDWTMPIVPLPQAPTASPVAGTYAGSQSVTLTSNTSGATIYYTTNGSTPTTSSSVYSGPITVSASETVKAIAANRSGSSTADSFAYSITGAAATPVISLAGGTYTTPQTYTVTSATADAAVYVTTDGTTPTSSSTLVTGSLQLATTETVMAIAIAGSSRSGVASAAYIYSPTSGTINTLAGGATSGDGILATLADFNTPAGVAVDSSGNLYIADTTNNRVRKVSAATGLVTTVAGTGVAGYVSTQDGAAATSAEISGPYGVALDNSGNLYIADTGNNRIRMVSASTGYISTVAGNGTAGYASSQDGGAATNAELNGPKGVAVDSSGNIYIADTSNSRIRKVTEPSGIITTVAGTSTAGYVSTQDGGAASSAEVKTPTGVAVDVSGNLFIADTGNNRIRKVTAATSIITTVAGNGTGSYSGDSAAATSAEINGPDGVAVDNSGNLYIADTSDNRIRKVTASTGIISTVAGTGTSGYTASQDGGAATSAKINGPNGIALDSSGNFYIADKSNDRIRKVTVSTGIITTVAGTGSTTYLVTGDGGAGINAALNALIGVAVDGSGNVYIADTSNNRIRKLNAATGIITTVAGNGVSGFSGDGAAATSAELSSPNNVAVDSSGNLYIADYNNQRIRKVAASTGYISTIAGNGSYGTTGTGSTATSAELEDPIGVAVDGSGNVYVSDNSQRVLQVNASSGNLVLYAGTGTAGYSASQDNGPATSAELQYPSGLAVDSSGNLYIADRLNNRIRVVNASSGNISTVAGNGNYASSGDGGLATSASLNQPWGVAVDSSGNIYIADTVNNKIRKVTASTSYISTFAGTGTSGSTGDGGAATNAKINGPKGVAVDSSGNVIIADTGNNRVRVVSH